MAPFFRDKGNWARLWVWGLWGLVVFLGVNALYSVYILSCLSQFQGLGSRVLDANSTRPRQELGFSTVRISGDMLQCRRTQSYAALNWVVVKIMVPFWVT